MSETVRFTSFGLLEEGFYSVQCALVKRRRRRGEC